MGLCLIIIMRWRNRLPSSLRRADKDVALNQVHLITGAQVTVKVDALWRQAAHDSREA